jgi:hypothetical protein
LFKGFVAHFPDGPWKCKESESLRPPLEDPIVFVARTLSLGALGAPFLHGVHLSPSPLMNLIWSFDERDIRRRPKPEYKVRSLKPSEP